MNRASASLVKNNESYAEMASRSQRSLIASYVIPVALEQEDCRDDIFADPDFQRALELVKKSHEAYPNDQSAWDWILIRYLDTNAAAEMAKGIESDKVRALENAIDRRLSPYSAAYAYSGYWRFAALENWTKPIEYYATARLKVSPCPM